MHTRILCLSSTQFFLTKTTSFNDFFCKTIMIQSVLKKDIVIHDSSPISQSNMKVQFLSDGLIGYLSAFYPVDGLIFLHLPLLLKLLIFITTRILILLTSGVTSVCSVSPHNFMMRHFPQAPFPIFYDPPAPSTDSLINTLPESVSL